MGWGRGEGAAASKMNSLVEFLRLFHQLRSGLIAFIFGRRLLVVYLCHSLSSRRVYTLIALIYLRNHNIRRITSLAVAKVVIKKLYVCRARLYRERARGSFYILTHKHIHIRYE